MSVECSECERDARAGHLLTCSHLKPRFEVLAVGAGSFSVHDIREDVFTNGMLEWQARAAMFAWNALEAGYELQFYMGDADDPGSLEATYQGPKP